MAGTVIPPKKSDIFQEEIDDKSAISEFTWDKFGALVNFINKRQYDTKQFFLNGPYQIGVGQAGLEGLIVFPFDMEIVGLSMFNIVKGSSGTTTLDVHFLSASGVDGGTIFSTKPSIDSNAPNNAYLSEIVATGQEASEGGTGLTLPVFSKTQFNQFDALRVDVDAVMVSAENCGLNLWLRPR